MLLDEAVRHNIDLVQYSNGVVRRIIAILNRADRDLFAQLTAALERLPPEAYTVERLETMLASVRRLNADAYRQVEQTLTGELLSLASEESEWLAGAYRMAAPAVQFASVTAETAYVAAMARPFQGKLLREWSRGIEADKMERIRGAVRMGYLEGQTIQQIVQRIRGTKARGYRDGIIEIDRRHAETVVRSAVSHMAGVARDRFVDANDDILGEVVWLSTLDGRTSFDCRLRDQKRYSRSQSGRYRPVGHKLPWGAGPGALHFNCRSSSVALLKGQKELPGTRASVQYKDGERPTGAQVRSTTSYGDWLRRQPAAVQDDVLGATRGALFRRGGLDIEAFANDKGQQIDLEELRRRNAAAFRRAGLE